MVLNVKQTKPDGDTTINRFVKKLDELGAPAKACRFGVQINPKSATSSKLPLTHQDLFHVCDAAQLPGRGFGVTEVRYYGPSQAFPNNSQYETATFSFICNQHSLERYYFDQWMEIINPTSTFNFEYANNYFADIKIIQFAEYAANEGNFLEQRGQTSTRSPDIIYGWTLRKAWPILVAPQQVTWADSDILRLQVTFTYKYWDREDFIGQQ